MSNDLESYSNDIESFENNTSQLRVLILFIDNYKLEFTKENNIIERLKGKKNIRKNFLEKIILYYDKDNFYIKDQESGSCSWFAIYYSIILYFVILKN